jgi:uroporphyrin-III C-methyltransferase
MTSFPKQTISFPEFRPGEVWLVGAGPGDPRHLTMLAYHALQSADDIVYDALVDQRIMDLIPTRAEPHFVGKRGGKPSAHQHAINEKIIALAKAGRRVARLKGGDPFVFGRGGEEAVALTRAGVPFRLAPGVTSGLAAPALVGIPATMRETNHALILATGHCVDEDQTRWAALAQTGQPLILYMALAKLAEISRALQRGGLSAETPVAIVSSAATEEERVLETSLGAAAADVEATGVKAPAIIVIGAIAALRRTLSQGMARDR